MLKKKRETIQKRKHKLASLVSLINAPAVWKIGDMNRPATYIYVLFNSFQPIINEHYTEEYERRDFIEFMSSFNLRFLSEINKIFSINQYLKLVYVYIFGLQV